MKINFSSQPSTKRVRIGLAAFPKSRPSENASPLPLPLQTILDTPLTLTHSCSSQAIFVNRNWFLRDIKDSPMLFSLLHILLRFLFPRSPSSPFLSFSSFAYFISVRITLYQWHFHVVSYNHRCMRIFMSDDIWQIVIILCFRPPS